MVGVRLAYGCLRPIILHAVNQPEIKSLHVQEDIPSFTSGGLVSEFTGAKSCSSSDATEMGGKAWGEHGGVVLLLVLYYTPNGPLVVVVVVVLVVVVVVVLVVVVVVAVVVVVVVVGEALVLGQVLAVVVDYY